VHFYGWRLFYAAKPAGRWQNVPLKLALEYSAQFLMVTTLLLETKLRSHLQLSVPQLEDHLVLQARVGICQPLRRFSQSALAQISLSVAGARTLLLFGTAK
jgi:hypothetical protein